ncbi:MAG TPA: ABC transporter [Deltaproteobacteria bacterium]|nr:ABC transporter [Deltaproteobacteria bacterium]HBG73439.1 ABC transporter [Deltaproteobacteria bacterium]
METTLSFVFALMDRLLPFSFAEPSFMKRAILSILLTAPAAAALGVPLVQHRMAFFSDAVGHSAFTGVALGVLLGVSPSWTMVAFGAFVAVAIILVKGRTDLSSDTVVGVFFSTVVALGIAVISREKGLTRNLQAFLYGDPLAVSDTELLWMAGVFLLVCAFLALLYNRILLLGIHEGFARTKGVRAQAVEISFALVVALVVTAAIRAVGILLVTALLVIPAATARNVARGAASALWISVAVAVLSGFSGIVASWYLDTATGATVVLAAAACFALTALYRAAVKRR